jgi:hypothetical protein
MPTEEQLIHRVYNAREKKCGSWFKLVTSPPNDSIGIADKRRFLKFVTMFEDSGGILRHVVGWAHPQLVFLMKAGSVSAFVDSTFRCVPDPFDQCLVLMIYDQYHKCYVPVFHVLMQTRTELAYWHAFNQIVAATDFKFELRTITSDFEAAELNAIDQALLTGQDTQCEKVYCCFHWVQANKRKLEALTIPKEERLRCLSLLRLLTVLPVNEIAAKAIPYVRSKLADAAYRDKYDLYWAYFTSTWLNPNGTFVPDMWNISRLLVNPLQIRPEVVNLTNNPLERYNRTLNESFHGTGHPSMAQFLQVIKDLAVKQVDRLENIRLGHAAEPEPELPIIPEVPLDYAAFVAP